MSMLVFLVLLMAVGACWWWKLLRPIVLFQRLFDFSPPRDEAEVKIKWPLVRSKIDSFRCYFIEAQKNQREAIEKLENFSPNSAEDLEESLVTFRAKIREAEECRGEKEKTLRQAVKLASRYGFLDHMYEWFKKEPNLFRDLPWGLREKFRQKATAAQ